MEPHWYTATPHIDQYLNLKGTFVYGVLAIGCVAYQFYVPKGFVAPLTLRAALVICVVASVAYYRAALPPAPPLPY
jgi:hypothetical protein